MFIRALELQDLAPGGLRGVVVEGIEVVLANEAGEIFALSRRCGHENAPLNFGTLNRGIITCPLHFAQFDARTGRASLGPANKDYGRVPSQQPVTTGAKKPSTSPEEGDTHDLRTFKVKVEGGAIWVDVSSSPPEFVMGPD